MAFSGGRRLETVSTFGRIDLDAAVIQRQAVFIDHIFQAYPGKLREGLIAIQALEQVLVFERVVERGVFRGQGIDLAGQQIDFIRELPGIGEGLIDGGFGALVGSPERFDFRGQDLSFLRERLDLFPESRLFRKGRSEELPDSVPLPPDQCNCDQYCQNHEPTTKPAPRGRCAGFFGEFGNFGCHRRGESDEAGDGKSHPKKNG